MKNNSIFRKILFSNVIVMVIPLVLSMSLLCYNICTRYKKEVIENRKKILSEYTQDLKTDIKNSVQRSKYILEYHYLIDNLSADFTTTSGLLEFDNNVKMYLDNITNDSGLVRIYTSNDALFEGKYILKLHRLKDYEKLQNRFKDENTDIIWSEELYTDERGNQHFWFYREMKLNPGNILACSVSVPASKQQHNILIENSGKMFDDKRYISEQLINSYKAVMEIEYGEIYKKYMETILLFLAVSIIIIAALIYIAYSSTTKITSNIDSFITSLSEKDIVETDIDLYVDSNDAKELQIIKNTIRTLVTKIKDATETQYKSELEKRNLELKLLQSQIDPHTLYNSFSAIKLNAFLRNDESTINLIDNMVDYYRAVLSKGEDFVTIGAEVEMIKKYIQINELSHDKQYRLILNIEEPLYNYKILHLLLQPFVENSIIHGLVGSRQNCQIIISCECKDGYMFISIEDNGYGINPSTLEKLNNLDEYDGSYGIKNAYLRLKLIYGEDSNIFYESKLNEGTKATIKFRLEN